jgi:hypothetical protein
MIYALQMEHRGEWISYLTDRSKLYCQGQFDVHSAAIPRAALRLVRLNDAGVVLRIVDETKAVEELPLGMIVGFPSAGQYGRATLDALRTLARWNSRPRIDPEARAAAQQALALLENIHQWEMSDG